MVGVVPERIPEGGNAPSEGKLLFCGRAKGKFNGKWVVYFVI